MQISKETELLLRPLIHPWIGRQLRLATSPESRTLEVGCGPGQYRFVVQGSYLGMDISAEDYRPGIPRALDLVADANAIPFQPASFDLVFVSNLFTHLKEGQDILRWSVTLLRAQGHIFIFDYSPPTLVRLGREYKRTGQDFTLYSRNAEEWLALFKQCGLKNPQVIINARLWKRISLSLISAVLGKDHYYRWIDTHPTAIAIYGEKE